METEASNDEALFGDLDAVPAVPSANRVPCSAVKHGGARSAKRESAESVSRVGKKKSRKDWSWELKLRAECSGKPCTACGRSDRSQDPTEPSHTRLWCRFICDDAEALMIVLKKDGSTCW